MYLGLCVRQLVFYLITELVHILWDGLVWFDWFMVFKSTFNNISVIEKDELPTQEYGTNM
jgi:hypothetical protein